MLVMETLTFPTTTRRTLNHEAIDEVIADLKARPTGFDMMSWVGSAADAPCGTTCCIAGDALLNTIPTTRGRKIVAKRIQDDALHQHDIVERAAKALGLNVRKRQDSWGGWDYEIFEVPLFYLTSWPKHYRDALGNEYLDDPTPVTRRQQARVAIRLLRDMKAGKVKVTEDDWRQELSYTNSQSVYAWWQQFAGGRS